MLQTPRRLIELLRIAQKGCTSWRHCVNEIHSPMWHNIHPQNAEPPTAVLVQVALVVAVRVATVLLAVDPVVLVGIGLTDRTQQVDNTMSTRHELARPEPIPSGHPKAIPTTLDI